MGKECDILIVGSGVAGLTLALKLSKFARVVVITKKGADDTATARAQGGIATVLDSADDFEYHIQDTIEAGAGLCNSHVVETIIRSGPDSIRELIDLGARFTTSDGKNLDLGKEGGHSHRRIVHAQDMTGREIHRVLLETALNSENIEMYENHTALNLVTNQQLGPTEKFDASDDKCFGCYVHDADTGEVFSWTAKSVILASGGAGKVYRYTSNPDVATGAGIAMAYRAGADIANMEFIQFHPTCLYYPEAKSFLISEAVRGEGGILRTLDGTPFMEKYHHSKDLAPRDIVARAIDSELKTKGDDHVLLDITHLPARQVIDRFPNIYQMCLEYGFDMTKDPLPVVPAAHYLCGGVMTDLDGRTSIPGLYACGEVACTGLHGANRLASNSLLESLVMADRIAKAIGRSWTETFKVKLPVIPDWDPGDSVDSDEMVVIKHNWDEIRSTMSNYVGIVRSNRRLERATHRIELLRQEVNEYYWNFRITRELIELRNIVTVAETIVRCATRRKESRGLHFTLDYPETDSNQRSDTVISRRDEVTK
ncbi:MAG: L-aspartate oxidase [bacterium]